ncbi:MAG: LPS assembly protein LptD [Candidatus Omnitrophota bacterium]
MKPVKLLNRNKFLFPVRFLLFFLFFLSISVNFKGEIVKAQEQSENSLPELTDSGKPVIVDADDVELDDARQKIVGRGNVKIDYDQLVLHSDFIEVDTRTKDAYATGNVILFYKNIKMAGEKLYYNFKTQKGQMFCVRENTQEKVPEDFSDKNVDIFYEQTKIQTRTVEFDLNIRQAFAPGKVLLTEGDSVLTGEKMIYNFQTETGTLNSVEGNFGLWYGRMQQAEKVNDDLVHLTRGFISTCDKDKPHYRVQAKRIYFYIDDKIVMKNVLLFVGNIPIMYFPYWQHSLIDDDSNFSVAAGHRKEWGWFALTSWRHYLNRNLKATIHMDERELKGFASGLDVDYKSDHIGSGQLKTYYMNERDKYYTDETDKRERNIEERERYRAQAKHRWQIDSSTLALFEYNKMSDIDFIQDYLYREYEQDVQPVSETSLTHYEPEYSVSLYARKRTNRFYSAVERLPEIELDKTSSDINKTGVYYYSNMQIANLNKKTANSAQDEDANRIDNYNELKYPTKFPGELDWINFSPYLGMRQSYYSKDEFGTNHDLVRGIHYYGFDLNTKFFRISDYAGKLFGIEVNRLRHVVTPSVKYKYIHNPTVDASKLADFDEIDAIAKTNVFTLGLENHLQTKWNIPNTQDVENVDLVYFYPHVDYYHRVKPGQRHFSYINTEFNVRPLRWLHIDSETVYNQYTNRFQTANIDLAAHSGEKWSVGLGKRYDRDISEQLIADLYYKINRDWQVRSYTRYLSYADVFQQQQYTIYRDLHCWLLEVTYDIKLNDDGSTHDKIFWFVLKLKAFPDENPLKFNVDYKTTDRI